MSSLFAMGKKYNHILEFILKRKSNILINLDTSLSLSFKGGKHKSFFNYILNFYIILNTFSDSKFVFYF